MLLTQKYAPKKIDDVAGNEDARTKIKQWILNWMRGVKQKPILISGPTGTGKTTIAYALKHEFDLELVETNTSDLRNTAQVEKVLANAATASSLSGKTKLILIDDVDASQANDRGGASAILSVLRTSAAPVILTATDAWNKKLSSIRSEAQIIDFRRISKSSVKKVLERICKNENMDLEEDKLSSIAENCYGDLRSAINDLQTGTSGMRDRKKDIFDRMKRIFKSFKYKEAREAGFGDIDHDFLKLWVDENIPIEYESKEDVSSAYNYLSRSDIYDGRIRKRQYWGFLRYSSDLLTAGVALSKSHKYMKFVRYQFPSYLRYMSSSISKRALRKSVGLKIGAKVHCKWKDSLDYLDIIYSILSKHPESRDFYRFEDEEAAFILGVSVSKLKPKEKKEKPKKKESPKKEEKPVKEEKKTKKAGTLHDFL
ncbi:replication factor C large subunit [Candidatus Micrarchaeota archaeon]|nr:replication factor C large subunit [Candidatus Micrarchaeota archaeon]